MSAECSEQLPDILTTLLEIYGTALGRSPVPIYNGSWLPSENFPTAMNESVNDSLMRGGMILATKERFWMYIIVLPIICVFGILANLCVVIVMSKRPEMQSRINTLLMGLAVFDALSLLLALILYPAYTVCLHNYGELAVCGSVLLHVKQILYPLTLASRVGSAWTSVCITIDRYIVICHPLMVKGKWTLSRARKLLIAIALCSLVYSIPTCFHHAQGMRNRVWYRNVYQTWFYLISLLIIPIGCMILFNSLCMKEMSKPTFRGRKVSGEKGSYLEAKRRIAVIVICIVITFTVFNFPTFITRLIKAIAGSEYSSWSGPMREKFMVAQMVGNILVLFNSATNFLIYCTFGRRFRRVFMCTFFPCFDARPATASYFYDEVEKEIQ